MWVKRICDICKNVLNGNIVMYFMVGILSLKENLILFVIIIFTFFILGYPHFINNIVLCRWQTKRSLTFNTKKHFSVHGSDFKSFPVVFDCMFVIASGMFGCLLTAVGCAFGDDKDPEESNEESRV